MAQPQLKGKLCRPKLSMIKYVPPASLQPAPPTQRRVTSLLTAGRRGATRPWIRARMPIRREKFHALVSCHCSAAWSPDKPRAGRAVSVLNSLSFARSLSLSLSLPYTCSFCFHTDSHSVFHFTPLHPTFHFLFFSSSLFLLYPFLSPTQTFLLMITEESRRPDKSFVAMATAK